MPQVKATLKNYRQSPRKVRRVAGLVRGKDVEKALLELNFLAKRASTPLAKLIESAVANAKERFGTGRGDLRVENITVDKGMVMKRSMPRARGRATPIRKKASHVTVVLNDIIVKKLKQSKLT
ncbi:50S ribosomal protein L22 [bacterium]|nr:50S ribosomal protein L22 [bacterium]